MKAAVIMDMFGCPNRCRHCWLGHGKNAHIPEKDFIWVSEHYKNYKQNNEPFFNELIFMTWYREPDFSGSYRPLWELEKQLSTVKVPRYELASVWRLARDEDYAPWLKSLGVDCVQITLFGTERNTDYFSGRKGAFRDCLSAIEVLLLNDIVPRVQMFPFSTTVDDFENLQRVFIDLKLEERTSHLGKEFACFFNSPTPTGAGYNLENIRMSKDDFLRLPPYFIEKTMKYFKAYDLDNLLKTEAELLPELLADNSPLNDTPEVTAFMVASDFNVYPNYGEIADWWSLGNLKTGGIELVMDAFLNHKNPGLKMNYEIPVKYFAGKYGDKKSAKLYTRGDLIQKWFRLEAMGVQEE